MKKFLFTAYIIIILAISDGYCQNRSITFSEKPWAEIQALARKENKLIFLDAYATWCGPCKWMSANIFTNDTIADYYNKTFVCAKIDMEKGEGISLAKQYGVRYYPTLLFINTEGEMIHKKVGVSRKISDYIDLGIIARDPDKCLAAGIKKYQAGNLDPVFMFSFLKNLQDAYIPTAEVLKKYIATQKSEDLINQLNWNIIYNFSEDINSAEFIFLVNHHKEFEQRFQMDSVQNKIYNVYSYELNKFFRMKPFPQQKWDSLINVIKKSGYSGANVITLDAQLNLYSSRKDTTKFLDLAYREADLVYRDDYTKLNNIAYQVYTISGNVKNLEKAAEWAKRSIKLKDEPFNNDTYAAILFKLGKKEEAIRTEKKAIELARKKNLPIKDYENSLSKMQSGK